MQPGFRADRSLFMEHITSRKNPQIQNLRALGQSRRARAEAGVFVLDGEKLLREAITTARIVLIEGEGAQGVYSDADAMNRRDDLAKLRASCDRLHNGSCSPCKFDCPLYRNGKCKDPMKEEV